MTVPPRRVAAVIAAAMLLCWSAAAAVAQETFTPWDVARLRTVTFVNASPDGSLIAYVLAVPRDPFSEPDGPAWTELHVIAADGGEARPYIMGQVEVTQPQWTPDGQAISFLATREPDTTQSLYAIPLQGGEAQRILTYETDIDDYAWHPDGTRVAFLAKPPTPEAEKELREKGFAGKRSRPRR